MNWKIEYFNDAAMELSRAILAFLSELPVYSSEHAKIVILKNGMTAVFYPEKQ